jgi:hypothetical protein
LTGSGPADPRIALVSGCATSVSGGSSCRRGRCTAVAVGCSVKVAAASRGTSSGERGSGGVEGGDTSAPSSWTKAVSSPGDEQPLLFLAALVSLGVATMLSRWTAAAGAARPLLLLLQGCCCGCKAAAVAARLLLLLQGCCCRCAAKTEAALLSLRCQKRCCAAVAALLLLLLDCCCCCCIAAAASLRVCLRSAFFSRRFLLGRLVLLVGFLCTPAAAVAATMGRLRKVMSSPCALCSKTTLAH